MELSGVQMMGPLWKIDYLNSIIPEDEYCQRFSCTIPLFLFGRKILTLISHHSSKVCTRFCF